MPKLLSRSACKRLCFISLFSLSSCATPLKIQSQVNDLTLQKDYARAKSLIGDNPRLYGRNNSLLYLLDKGLILHLSGDYKQSIDAFEKAKLKFDELYTKSASAIAGTWLINEYAACYRGEDFERVMINIFQALNYLMLSNLGEALVEARDADVTLSAINSRYKPGEKNAYKEDAFARLLMGILYEAHDTSEDLNNAFISYVKAVEAYENDYAGAYHLAAPEILKKNILSVAEYMGGKEFNKYKAKYKGVPFVSLGEKAKKAEVYLIQYDGFSPVKIEDTLFIPFPDGYVFKLAFPKYERKSYKRRKSIFGAKNGAGGFLGAEAQPGENISAIAIKNLENRKLRVTAKALASAGGKYLLEKSQEANIRKRFGNKAADSFKIVSDIFNIHTVKADVRSWRVLPAEISIARLLLEPGEYSFFVDILDEQGKQAETVELGAIKVSAGEKKFFLLRS